MTEDSARPPMAAPGWLERRGRWSRLFLAILFGALMTGGHTPIALPWLLFLAVPGIALLAGAAPTPRAAAWVGWGAGFGYFVTGLHWVGNAFLVDADRFAWLIPLGVAALPAGLAIFWAIAFWLARRLCQGGPLASAIVLASFWTLAEYGRGNVLTGLPWSLPGYVWVDTPIMQAAAWIGPYGLSHVTLALTAIPLLALASLRPARALLPAGLALAAVAGLWVAGTLRVPAGTAYAADAPVLRIVQPNAPQHLKWQPGYREEFYRRQLAATGQPPLTEHGPPDIVIWPEASVYFVLAEFPERRGEIARAAGGATVLMGALHGELTATGERWSNAFASILPDGSLGPRYDKHHLVPFGEYLPLKPLFDALGLSQFAVRGGFTPGPGPRTMHVPGVPPFSPLICYEAIFPNRVVAGERPEWMVQPTNDAWFGSWAGPRQHYAQASIRAIEQGLPIVRAANTGISAVVDPYGRETGSIGLDRYAILDARLPDPLDPTLYSRTGDWLALAFVAFCAAFLCIFRLADRAH